MNLNCLTIERYEPPKPFRVRRTWFERYFTRPWRPWRLTRWVTPAALLAPTEAYRIGNRIVAGAHVFDTIKSLIPVAREDRHGAL